MNWMNFKALGRSVLGEEKWLELRDKRHYRKTLKKWLTGKEKDLNDLYALLIQSAVPIRSPLVLISQIQRSGGTLLSQLFDGHPECHAHPFELYIGYPNKSCWPRLDLNDKPDRWFEILFESPASKAFRYGYQKYGRGRDDNADVFPLFFLPSVQREIFLNYVAARKEISLRDIFDGYMTSYFNAWLNRQNSRGDKKFITAFVPRMTMYEDNVDAFFSIYPDGRLLSIVRDPKSWYFAARKHDENDYGNIDRALQRWKESAQAMVKNKRKYGDRVRIIRFEDLVGRTEAVMRSLAMYLSITFDEILTVPTFNRLPIKAGSGFPVESYGVILDPLTRHHGALSEGEIHAINRIAGETYKKVLEEVSPIEIERLTTIELPTPPSLSLREK